jgi:hypothetical protein
MRTEHCVQSIWDKVRNYWEHIGSPLGTRWEQSENFSEHIGNNKNPTTPTIPKRRKKLGLLGLSDPFSRTISITNLWMCPWMGCGMDGRYVDRKKNTFSLLFLSLNLTMVVTHNTPKPPFVAMSPS